MGDLTNNFSRYEFACKCGCGYDKVNRVFVERLQRIRDRVGFRMPVNSGCRCEPYNRDEEGSENSDHLTGEGSDIRVRGSRNRYLLCQAAFEEGIPRIAAAKKFVHLGVREDNDQEVMWVY